VGKRGGRALPEEEPRWAGVCLKGNLGGLLLLLVAVCGWVSATVCPTVRGRGLCAWYMIGRRFSGGSATLRMGQIRLSNSVDDRCMAGISALEHGF
jgi:hypothetical protein